MTAASFTAREGVTVHQGVTRGPDGRVLDDYNGYSRWAIGPLMDRAQWEADQRLLHSDFPAWRKRHGI